MRLLLVWSLHPSCEGWVWLPPGFCPGCSRPSGTQTHRGPAFLQTVKYTLEYACFCVERASKKRCVRPETYMSVLSIIEEIQSISTETRPQTFGSLSQKEKKTCQKQRGCSVDFPHLSIWYFLLLSYILPQEINGEQQQLPIHGHGSLHPHLSPAQITCPALQWNIPNARGGSGGRCPPTPRLITMHKWKRTSNAIASISVTKILKILFGDQIVSTTS